MSPRPPNPPPVSPWCPSCVSPVSPPVSLRVPAGVRLLELRLEAQTVLVETELAAERVRELLEASGRRAVLKGMGGAEEGEYEPLGGSQIGPGRGS